MLLFCLVHVYNSLSYVLVEWKQQSYLLIVDYYSRFIEIAQLNGLTASEVITRTKSIFARHETVVSDNGPQYSSEAYKTFAEDYQFKHVTSSPYFPQSNGEAERAVRTIKDLLKKSGDPYLALLAYRSTPLEVDYSPSQLLMSRTLRSSIPTTRAQRVPQIPDSVTVGAKDDTIKARQKRNFDSRHGARTLPTLKQGDSVWLPDREKCRMRLRLTLTKWSHQMVRTAEIAETSFHCPTPLGHQIPQREVGHPKSFRRLSRSNHARATVRQDHPNDSTPVG